MKAEEKALELYPIEDFPFREDAESQYKLRAAFLKGYEYANQQPTKTVEQRALELYPPDLVAYGIAATDEDDLVFDNNDAARRAYIKGATDNQKQIR